MKKIFFIIYIFLILSIPAWATTRNETTTSATALQNQNLALTQNIANLEQVIKELRDQNLFLKQSIPNLEQKIELNYKHYDAILENKRSNYTDNITALSTILFLGLALVGLFNFKFVKEELSRGHKEEMLKIRSELLSTVENTNKELAATTQTLRENFNNSTQDLRKEFPQQILSSIKDIEQKTDKKLIELTNTLQKKSQELEADHFAVLSRVYEESNTFYTAALWAARATSLYFKCDFENNQWIGVSIRRLCHNLKQADASCVNDKFFHDIEQALLDIPNDPFQKEKDELQEIIQKKKSEAPKTEKTENT
jgi:hypothetical protein